MNPRGRIAKWWLRNLPAKVAVLGGTLIATGTFFGIVRAHPLAAASNSTDTPTANATSPVATPPQSFNSSPRQTAPTPAPAVPRARRSRRS